uniref:Uncharacterized protein n=1 Tax=Arundo donax TaxID=35708 RepID=A0A0A9BET6_ARUDO
MRFFIFPPLCLTFSSHEANALFHISFPCVSQSHLMKPPFMEIAT